MTARGLHSGFLSSAERFPDRPALEADGETLTYAQLRDSATAIAATLAARAPQGDPPVTAVFAHRTPTAFAGVLGTLIAGDAYVPLNRTHPVARSRATLARAGARAVIADAASVEQLNEIVRDSDAPLLILCPETNDIATVAAGLDGHMVLGASDLEQAPGWKPAPPDPDALAYLLFTSGSTGVPKGVMVAHRNVFNLIDTLVERYGIVETDRVSQTHDMTFDVSVFDMFVPWECGACVCCLPERSLIKPGRFIREHELTVWASVPSTGIFMRRLGELKPGSYPTLRWSLFAGEPFPVEMVEAWQKAAPNTVIENCYGPTEVTVYCVVYRWDGARSLGEAEHGMVPIGAPLPNLGALIADEETQSEVAPGEIGELLVAGPQVTLGYWRDPGRTEDSFVVPDGRSDVHYRTGDRVRRPVSDAAPITYLGRVDDQIKIRGMRVEPGEIEAALREETGVDAVVVIGWPKTVRGADAVEAFVGAPGVALEQVTKRLRERLPTHMVPRVIHLLDALPVNANGKFDRSALRTFLQERDSALETTR